LGWDEINKATYQFAEDKFGYDNAIKLANSKITSNNSLSLIKSNAQWLANNNEKPISLNVETYKAVQKSISATVAQNSTITKLKDEMNISVTTSDYSKYFANPDKQKGERYQSWLKFLKTDLYIQTTTNIVCDMITNSNSSVNK